MKDRQGNQTGKRVKDRHMNGLGVLAAIVVLLGLCATQILMTNTIVDNTSADAIKVGLIQTAFIMSENELSDEDQYTQLKAKAEVYFDEKSYKLSHDIYSQAAELVIPAEELRWIQFRLADTLWRADASSSNPDQTNVNDARGQLSELINAIKREVDRDLVWAESQESLADSWWQHRQYNNWNQGWQHYNEALGWWAKSADIDTARKRYLDIVWIASEGTNTKQQWYYLNYPRQIRQVPTSILRDAVKIAVSDEDVAHAHFLLAASLQNRGSWGSDESETELQYEHVLDIGDHTSWYDDALYHCGQWLEQYGRFRVDDAGNRVRKHDFVGALEYYTQLTTKYTKGESVYYGVAKDGIARINGKVLDVNVSDTFLPGSETRFYLQSRNIGTIDFRLAKIDLLDDLKFKKVGENPTDLTAHIRRGAGETIRSWAVEVPNAASHKYYSESIRIDHINGEMLPVGVYSVEAKSGKSYSSTLLMVTDLAIILKTTDDTTLGYVCDAIDGSPVKGASVRLWTLRNDKPRDKWSSVKTDKHTNDDGLCRIKIPQSINNVSERRLYIASINGRQAFASTNDWYSGRENVNQDEWNVYAFTDKPAYRPGEKVMWKMTARVKRGKGYTTPSGRKLTCIITDERGAILLDTNVTLNEFGSYSGELELDDTVALGMCEMSLTEGNKHVGYAQVFRVEEYKLPEFKVSVSTPKDNDGNPKIFRVGDQIEASILAEYYFGGPVTSAEVEIIVHQKSFYHTWAAPREYPWIYEDVYGYDRHWWDESKEISRQTLTTNNEGIAIVTFDTSGDDGEYEYSIEARVTDQSRREIIGTGSVFATRQSYYVHTYTDHQLYSPGDTVKVHFKAMDANKNPISRTGDIKIMRKRWVEIWLDPNGNEVFGDRLEQIQHKYNGIFPPPPIIDEDNKHNPVRMWKLKSRGYEEEVIQTTQISTNKDKGEAELRFKADREGFYAMAWSSPGHNKYKPITSETTIWSADNNSKYLGYRHGGVQIIIDKDTVELGKTVPVMIVAEHSNTDVLFTAEGEDLYNYRVIHLDGTVKLTELKIEKQYIPNIQLSAAFVRDGQQFGDSVSVYVPPTPNFLDINVVAENEVYQPRDTSTFTITAKNHEGNPVSADLAVALVDESILYVQDEIAGDPRKHFYNEQQYVRVNSTNSFHDGAYIKYVVGPTGELVNADELTKLYWDHALGSMAESVQSKDDGAVYYAHNKQMLAKSEDLEGGVGGARFRSMNSAAPQESGAQIDEMSRLSGDTSYSLFEVESDSGNPDNIIVRSDFRSTALWLPSVQTDEDGKAIVTATLPDTLTRWKATVRGNTKGNKFGIGDTAIQSRMPLMIRLQAPRFFTEGDIATISALVNNTTETDENVSCILELDGVILAENSAAAVQTIIVPGSGEVRVDWQINANVAGTADIAVKAVSMYSSNSDAMQRSYPIHEHGIVKLVAKSGVLRERELTFNINLPEERKLDSTELEIQVTPSVAVTMLDALPYLIDYPYGCTEQTMSRFLPSVITLKTLNDLGIDKENVASRLYGGIETEFADQTHQDGKKDLDDLEKMIDASLDRISDFQHSDGGWGWWKKGDSDLYMSAYVVWGLSLAKDADVAIDQGKYNNAVRYLRESLVDAESKYDLQAWMLHALSYVNRESNISRKSDIHQWEQAAFANLWEHREHLNAYTRSMLAIAAHRCGYADEAAVLIRNLENGVQYDASPDTSIIVRSHTDSDRGQPWVMQTAHWGNDGIYYRWSDGGVEATAFVLLALLEIDPDHQLIEPTMNWLIKNRRGSQWSNTKDTAIVVLAINKYLMVSDELETPASYEVIVNDKSVAVVTQSADEMISAPNIITIDPSQLRDGDNEVRILNLKESNAGSLYFAAYAHYYSLEEPITPVGSEIFIRRQYYRIVPRPTLLAGSAFDRIPLSDGDMLVSGERVEVVLTVETKNNYEYLIFEDHKPAGLEATKVKSGEPIWFAELTKRAIAEKYDLGVHARSSDQLLRDRDDYTGRRRYAHQELRDHLVAFFVDKLPQGTWELHYELRAEVPGIFHALPAVGQAMYTPEIRGNSAEVRLGVKDKE